MTQDKEHLAQVVVHVIQLLQQFKTVMTETELWQDKEHLAQVVVHVIQLLQQFKTVMTETELW